MVLRNTRLVISCNMVLASQVHSSSVHSPASKYKSLICLELNPNSIGFQKRGSVNKRELRKGLINMSLCIWRDV